MEIFYIILGTLLLAAFVIGVTAFIMVDSGLSYKDIKDASFMASAKVPVTWVSSMMPVEVEQALKERRYMLRREIGQVIMMESVGVIVDSRIITDKVMGDYDCRVLKVAVKRGKKMKKLTYLFKDNYDKCVQKVKEILST